MLEAMVSTDGIVESPVKLMVDTGAVQLLQFVWTGVAVPRPPILVTHGERLLMRDGACLRMTVLRGMERLELEIVTRRLI